MVTALLILLAALVLSGLRLGLGALPYSALPLAAHKIIALVAVALGTSELIKIFKTAGFSAFAICFFAAFILVAAALFVSGAFLSAGASRSALFRQVHIGASALIVMAAVLAALLAARS